MRRWTGSCNAAIDPEILNNLYSADNIKTKEIGAKLDINANNNLLKVELKGLF